MHPAIPASLRNAQPTRLLQYGTLSLALALAFTMQAGQAQVLMQASPVRSFHIQAGPLRPALEQFARTTGLNLAYDSAMVQNLRTGGSSGSHHAAEALNQLLEGTGLQAVAQPAGGFALQPAAPATGAVSALPAITVTSSAPAEDAAFGGGQVARSGSLGLLGQRGFLETPFSTMGYTAKLIADQQATSVAEILTGLDPSVRAAIGNSNRYDAYTIRGFRVPNSDVALNGLYGLLPNYRIGSDSVERIDLLRGPSALLNGIAPGGSVGGAVNIVTKRATEQAVNEVTMEYASPSRSGLHMDLGRRYGDDKAFGVRINAALRDGDTAYDNQKMRSKALSLGSDYHRGALKIEGDLIYQGDWMQAPERGYSVAAGVAVPAVPDAHLNVSQRYDFSDTESTTALGRIEYALNDGMALYAAVGGNQFNFNKRESPGGTIIAANGNVSTVSTAQHGSYKTHTGEAGMRLQLRTAALLHEATLSVNRLHQDYRLGQTAYPTYLTNLYIPVSLPQQTTPVAATTYAAGPATDMTLRSVAVADVISTTDGYAELTLGLRRQEVTSHSYAPASALVTRRYSSSATTPMLGVVIHPAPSLALYASYVEALTQGPQPPATAINSSDVFAPYKTRQYETGVKADFGGYGATASLFQITSPTGITDPSSRIFSLDGEQRHRGLELSGFGEVVRGLRLLGGVTTLHAIQTSTAGGTYDGRRAIGVPRLQANLTGEWDLPRSPGWTATARMVHTGQTCLNAANTQSVSSWTRLDLGLRYMLRTTAMPLTLRANLGNVFNRHHWEANPSGYLLVGSARAATLSATMSF